MPRTPAGTNAVAVGLFARLPVPGKVKTRLARSIGEDRAAEVYRLCAERTFSETLKLQSPVRRYIFFEPAAAPEEFETWAPPGFSCRMQTGPDLGERMKNALAAMFADGASAALLAGTDIPDLSETTLRQAFDGVAAADIVIGPTHDGGYYLIGMKILHSSLFSEISWSTDRVLMQTLAKGKALGLVPCKLPCLLDIDTEADLARWLATTPSGQSHPLSQFLHPL